MSESQGTSKKENDSEIDEVELGRGELTDGDERVFQALHDHPFLSRRQLELYHGRAYRMIHLHLKSLANRGWIERHNARQPWMRTRALFSLTEKGVARAAANARAKEQDYGRQMGLDLPRLEQLLVMMECVFQVRTFLLWLQQKKANWDWAMPYWDVEVDKLFDTGDESFKVPFHGAGVMVRPNGRWNMVAVELDLRRVPVEKDRERLVRFVLAQTDRRFSRPENREEFPVWVLIAQEEFRLQDYYAVLRATATAEQLPMPRAYLTTFAQMRALRDDPALPIWHSTVSGQRKALLADAVGSSSPLPIQPPWSKLRVEPQKGKQDIITWKWLADLSQGADQKLDLREVKHCAGAIALVLKPLEKRVLEEIAAHPLLTTDEMALLLRLAPWRVAEAAQRLVELDFAAEHVLPTTVRDNAPEANKPRRASERKRYLLAEGGLHYLAMIAGFQSRVERYARARGWAQGFDSLLEHWQHTHEENAFFLEMARIAEERKHELVWLSELESRLYYDYGNDSLVKVKRPRPRAEVDDSRPRSDTEAKRKNWRRSFLPDGRGTYIANGQRYEFALEIDRSRMPMAKFQRKLSEYFAAVASNILRGRGIELLRLLIVTNSWERAETLEESATKIQEKLKSAKFLPVLITTFDRLRASGIDHPIWLRAGQTSEKGSALTAAKDYSFDCFVPKPKAPREPGRVTYKS
ncbi:MAG: replication-relaxation family protein [Chloroflexi bacterium]|nr:replication-relaxation family protein [Chloroflexota bacterium]